MDAFLTGEMLFAGATVVTPWMKRSSNSGVFAVEVLAISGVTMTATIETKAHDATDASPGTVGTISGVNAVGVAPSTLLEDFEDLYRYQISTGATASLDWIWFRILAPSWTR